MASKARSRGVGFWQVAGDEGFGFRVLLLMRGGIWCIKVAKAASGNIELGDWG